jgi:hypothetical protein
MDRLCKALEILILRIDEREKARQASNGISEPEAELKMAADRKLASRSEQLQSVNVASLRPLHPDVMTP